MTMKAQRRKEVLSVCIPFWITLVSGVFVTERIQEKISGGNHEKYCDYRSRDFRIEYRLRD